jgi:hypothetical protein
MRPIAIAVAAAALMGVATVWLYLDNRRLSGEVARLRAEVRGPGAAAEDPWASRGGGDGPVAAAGRGLPRGLGAVIGGAGAPELPAAPRESRLERRNRRTDEVAGLLGRHDGESEEDYRARVMPLVEMGLARPRENLADQRRQAEEAAGVTAEQRQQLDATFTEVYDELLTYTNAAIQDGQLTPYERNVAGMLEYAGGLGAILGGAEQRIGSVLSPDQVRTIYGTGFEWSEYLGVNAPWEQLRPPPPRPGGG